MPYTLQQQEFSGPLDLLLELIENKKKDITDVALSEVTEDFLAYVDKQTVASPDELADFLVVAAKLLLMKSSALLPFEMEEDEGPSLEAQLRLYKEFVNASKLVDAVWKKGNVAYGRFEKPVVEPGFYPPPQVGIKELHAAMTVVAERIDSVRLPQKTIQHVVSLKEKIAMVREIVTRQRGPFSFTHMMTGAHSKADLIVTFLALLELVKSREVRLRQDASFGDIYIHP